MKKIALIILTLLPFIVSSQNVGISSDSSFIPQNNLDVDGSVRVRSNIYLEDSIIDLDNSNYLLDLSSQSKMNEIQFDDGTESDPSIWFNNDGNTGLYQPYDGSIGFTINGTESIRITSNRDLHLNDNDITGLKQLHFNTGEIYINGNPGDSGQVIKSDGQNIYWSNIEKSPIKDSIIFKSLSNSGEILWSHPLGIDVYVNPLNEIITVNNNSTDSTEWVIFIEGRADDTQGSNKVITNDISKSSSLSIDIGGSNAGAFKIIAGKKLITKGSNGFIMNVSFWSTNYSGLVEFW